MHITVIGRGNVGGGLARRWQRAGHTVTELGHDAIGLIGAVAQGRLGMFFYRYAEPGKL